MQEQLLAYAMTYGPKVLVAIALLAAGYFAGRWAARVTGRSLQRYDLEIPVRALLESITRLFVFGLFAIMALQNLGVELLPLIAGLGVAGAAVALALQGVLGNVAAGLMIIFAKPFRVGDYVSIVGVHGEVLEIRLSTTTLGHADLSRVVIPNRKIVGEILHNYGRVRQLALEVTVPLESDVDEALDTVRAVLRANARVLKDPAPGVGIAKLGEANVTLSVAPWVSVVDYGAAGGEVNRAILDAFRNRRILRPVAAAYLAESRADGLAGRNAA
jgi:small conductance mechanosensitive channel